VFVRELISNASDALEKARHEGLRAGTPAEADAELAIYIDVDNEVRPGQVSLPVSVS
jgi:HSP90 family molecular chaperone